MIIQTLFLTAMIDYVDINWYIDVLWIIALRAVIHDHRSALYHTAGPIILLEGASQLITRPTRHAVKSCDKLTVVSDGVVTSW